MRVGRGDGDVGGAGAGRVGDGRDVGDLRGDRVVDEDEGDGRADADARAVAPVARAGDGGRGRVARRLDLDRAARRQRPGERGLGGDVGEDDREGPGEETVPPPAPEVEVAEAAAVPSAASRREPTAVPAVARVVASRSVTATAAPIAVAPPAVEPSVLSPSRRRSR